MALSRVLANVLQAVGLAAIAAGVYVQWPWLGIVVAGVGAVLLGLALER